MEESTFVTHGCRNTKKLKCGMEGKNVVVYGRLPSIAPLADENSARYEPKRTVRVQHYVQSFVQDLPVCPDYTVLFISWIWRIIKVNRTVLQSLDKYIIFKGTIYKLHNI